MDLSQIHTQKFIFYLYFKLYNSKFARDLQNTQTQTQNPNTQTIENPNPNLNLLVLLGAYVWVVSKSIANFETGVLKMDDPIFRANRKNRKFLDPGPKNMRFLNPGVCVYTFMYVCTFILNFLIE